MGGPFVTTSVFGAQVYSGSEAAPHFAVGSFTGLVNAMGDQPATLTFTAAPSAAPEASTWALMLVGFAGVAAVSYGARRRAAAA